MRRREKLFLLKVAGLVVWVGLGLFLAMAMSGWPIRFLVTALDLKSILELSQVSAGCLYYLFVYKKKQFHFGKGGSLHFHFSSLEGQFLNFWGLCQIGGYQP